VSNKPGASIIEIFFPLIMLHFFVQSWVTDEAEVLDMKTSFPRMVFPVALFPTPVFPIRTIRISSIVRTDKDPRADEAENGNFINRRKAKA